MRSTLRLFMAAILFSASPGLVSAQDPAPAPPAPDVAKPAELPPLPVAEPNAQAVAPASTADQTAPPVEPALTLGPAALAVETSAPTTVEPLAEKPVATTARRVTKKTATKPAVKPESQTNESHNEAAPAAGTAAADTTASLPPPQAPAAPVKSIASAPAAANTVVAEETKSQTTMGTGGWLLAGMVVACLAFVIAKVRGRRTKKRTSIVDFTAVSPGLKPGAGPASL